MSDRPGSGVLLDKEQFASTLHFSLTSFVPPMVDASLHAHSLRRANLDGPCYIEGHSGEGCDIAGLPAARVVYSNANKADRIVIRCSNRHQPLDKLPLRHHRLMWEEGHFMYAAGHLHFDFRSSSVPARPRTPIRRADTALWLEHHQQCLDYVNAFQLCLHSAFCISCPMEGSRRLHGYYPYHHMQVDDFEPDIVESSTPISIDASYSQPCYFDDGVREQLLHWTTVEKAAEEWRHAIALHRAGRPVIRYLSLFHSSLSELERHSNDSAFASLWMIIEQVLREMWAHIQSELGEDWCRHLVEIERREERRTRQQAEKVSVTPTVYARPRIIDIMFWIDIVVKIGSWSLSGWEDALLDRVDELRNERNELMHSHPAKQIGKGTAMKAAQVVSDLLHIAYQLRIEWRVIASHALNLAVDSAVCYTVDSADLAEALGSATTLSPCKVFLHSPREEEEVLELRRRPGQDVLAVIRFHPAVVLRLIQQLLVMERGARRAVQQTQYGSRRSSARDLGRFSCQAYSVGGDWSVEEGSAGRVDSVCGVM